MTATYSVQVLVPHAVRLEPLELHQRLVAWRHDVELLRGAGQLTFVIPTNDLPLIVSVFETPPETYAAPLCDALTWTPWWHERWDDIAVRCPTSIVVELTVQRPLNHASMLLAFLATLDAVLSELPDEDREGAVLHWIPAQQLLTIERYRELRVDHGPCGPAVNVRIANATGRPGELLADTVGLAELGLPDLQMVFTGRDPAEVAMHLRLLVRSMFVGDRLDCGWVEETAFVPPARDALTLQLD
ncbi:MAG TPA: hypothetical protein VN253_17840 [Kofleriaceae bacterium]|nr:hypothetical protein [Kofleriaceae bacterium]